ncbi:DUF2087 domain-containing protein [Desulfovibrio aerotolerans]|uniref:DUF2087 domain-containing protein n=1 Tax=Solidesulfovibrio aerotolerans TaxID=295255 RepID=A0A7C9IMW6_9BACT|nr:DUF2087 domain-containing protein [Solidesulfovibrio aerotolerans]MYL83866.1 DUF2087 domain-containing protein [Solidesulfovibrio aerotolerans]
MSRESFPYAVDDMAALAKSLRGCLAERAGVAPGHVEMLNILAKAAGCRNFQHYRANVLAREQLATRLPAAQPQEPVDFVRLRRLLRHFDAAGRLVRWPAKYSEQQPCLWLLWSRLPSRRVMTEREVGEHLTASHSFGDAALLRRQLCDAGLMARTPDCREYRRVEGRPAPLGLALIEQLRRVGTLPVAGQTA